jgi:hypothetical protein
MAKHHMTPETRRGIMITKLDNDVRRMAQTIGYLMSAYELLVEKSGLNMDDFKREAMDRFQKEVVAAMKNSEELKKLLNIYFLRLASGQSKALFLTAKS